LYLVVLHEDDCLKKFDLCRIVSDIMECEEKPCSCISVRLCTSIPLQSVIMAYIKTVKAFERGGNVAEHKGIEMLLKLFGVRQIKTLMKVLNEHCRGKNYTITIAYINKILQSEEATSKIVDVIVQKLNNIGCGLIGYNNLNAYTHGCRIVESLLPILRKHCNDIALMGVSGTGEAFIS